MGWLNRLEYRFLTRSEVAPPLCGCAAGVNPGAAGVGPEMGFGALICGRRRDLLRSVNPRPSVILDVRLREAIVQ